MIKEFKRVKMLDTLRGSALIFMILVHIIIDIELFGFFKDVPFIQSWTLFLDTPIYTVIWLVFLSIFFLVAGAVSNYSKSNFKRGLIVVGLAFALTIITVFFIKGNEIYFGVLHCMGFSMLLFWLINKFFPNFIRKIPLLLFFALFIIYYVLINKFSPIVGVDMSFFGAKFELPLFVFGFYSYGFFSADYYPLFPWFFMFLAGVKIGTYLKDQKFPSWFYVKEVPFLSFLGKYPLFVYFGHQPIVIGLLFLIDKLI